KNSAYDRAPAFSPESDKFRPVSSSRLFLDKRDGLTVQLVSVSFDDFSFTFLLFLFLYSCKVIFDGVANELRAICSGLAFMSDNCINAFQRILFNSDRNSFHIVLNYIMRPSSNFTRACKVLLTGDGMPSSLPRRAT